MADYEIHATVGEPALGPGQGDDVEALRTSVITGSGGLGVGGRGFHAVGVAVPGVQRIVCSTGKAAYSEAIEVGECSITTDPAAEITDNGTTYDFELLEARVVGARQLPGQIPTPSPLDTQSLTVSAMIEGQHIPIWGGYAYEGDRIKSRDGIDSFSLRGREFIYWIASARLDPRWLDWDERAFQPQTPQARIEEILRRIAYAENATAAVYNPTAVIDIDNWDFFCPRRTRQGFGNLPTDLILPHLAAEEGGELGVQDHLRKIMLAAEGQLLMHQGIGPIRTDRQAPDRRTVPAADGYPGASVQIDWGGVLAAVMWGKPDDGTYTTGGFETPIKLQPLPTTKAWEAEYRMIHPRPSGERTLNIASWSGLDADGVPVDPGTFIFDSEGGQETKKWIRRYGVREHTAAGLPWLPSQVGADYKAVSDRARRFLATHSVPRPTVQVRLTAHVKGDQAKVMAHLGAGHLVALVHDHGETRMHVTQIEHDIQPNGWTATVTMVPAALEFDGGRVQPRMPLAYAPPNKYDGPGAKNTSVNKPSPGVKLAPAPSIQRFGPKARSSRRNRLLIYWTGPADPGPLPILATLVGAKVKGPGGAGSIAPTGLTRQHPWKMWWESGDLAELGIKGADAVVEFETRMGRSGYAPSGLVVGGGQSFAVPPDTPPGPPRSVDVVRPPGSSTNIHIAWRPPAETGSSLPRGYHLYLDDSDTPIAFGGNVNIDAGTPLILNYNYGAKAGTLRVAAVNNAGVTIGETVAIPAYKAPASTAGAPSKPPPPVPVFTWGRLEVVWGAPASVGAGITDLEFQVRRNGHVSDQTAQGAARYRGGHRYWGWSFLTAAGFGGGDRWDRVEMRMRVTNASGWSEWSDWRSLAEALEASAPRDLDIIRTSDTRKAADSWLAAWSDPLNPPGIPQSRADDGATIDTGAYFTVPQPSGPVTDDDRYGVYDVNATGVTAKQGWGPSYYHRAATAASEIRASIRADAAGLHGAEAAALLPPADELMPPPSNLTAFRKSRSSTTVYAFAEMPRRLHLSWMPHQYRFRCNGGAWTVVDLFVGGTVSNRPALAAFTVPTGTAAKIEAQARNEISGWPSTVTDVNTAVVTVPAILSTAGSYRQPGPGRKGPGAVDEATPGPPRNLRACVADLHVATGFAWADHSDGVSGGIRLPSVDPANAWTLVLGWDEPIAGNRLRSPISVRAARYAVTLTTSGGVWLGYMTSNADTHLEIPISDPLFRAASIPNGSDIGTEKRPGEWMRASVRSLSGSDKAMSAREGWTPADAYLPESSRLAPDQKGRATAVLYIPMPDLPGGPARGSTT